MARSLRALWAACALGLSLGSSATDDSSVMVQLGAQLMEKRQGKGILEEIAEMAVEETKALRAEVGKPLQLTRQQEEPTPTKGPLWYGVLFERKVMKVEDGTVAKLTFDHGCSERDTYGDNYCEFPHGDSFHMKFEFRLSKPISDGFFVFTGDPFLQGLMAIIKNKAEGSSEIFQHKMTHLQVECPVCGDTCEALVLGKKKTLKLHPCPLPANQNVTIFEGDVDLPPGDMLSLIGLHLQAEFMIMRQEGEASSLVSRSKVVMRMGRIYHGMPTIM